MIKFLFLFSVSVCVTAYLLELQCFKDLLGSRGYKGRLFTSAELAEFDGVRNKELYLAILGNVFDVSKGAKYYGPGENYHIFIGQDSSRSFVTGQFEKIQSSDSVIDFSNQELRSLNHWVQFYKKEYTKVGKLIGKYYNDKGKLTPYGKEVKLLIKSAEQAHANDDLEKLKFPPCNVEWDPQKGTRVWCTKKSGGISRNWIGVPRQLYEVGAEAYRCACIHEGNKYLGNIKEYEGCDPDSDSCTIKTTE